MALAIDTPFASLHCQHLLPTRFHPHASRATWILAIVLYAILHVVLQGFGSFIISDMLGVGLGYMLADGLSSTMKQVTGRNATPLEKGCMAASSTLLTLLINMPLEVTQRRM